MRDSFAPILLASFVLLAFGCGSKEKAPRVTDAGTASGAKMWSASDGVATIRGTALFPGTPPKPRRIDMGAAKQECADKYKAEHGHYPVDPSIQVKDGKLANVFVFVKAGLEAWKFPVPSAPKTLNQKYCLYEPHVEGIQVGQKLRIINSDPLLHNVLAMSKNHEFFETVQSAGERATQSFGRECVMVAVTCNVHSWMQAYIGVLDHPFYAVTAEDGTYTLPKLPAGTYTLVAWHEKFGRQEKTVTIGKGETKQVDFTFRVSG